MSWISLICWGSLKEALIFQASSWKSQTPESPVIPTTKWVWQSFVPSIQPTFHNPLPEVLGRYHSLCLPLVWRPAPERNIWHPVPTQVGALSQTLNRVIQPLGPLMPLGLTEEGYGWENELGCPLVRLCSAACSTPRTFSSIGHDSKKECRSLPGIW